MEQFNFFTKYKDWILGGTKYRTVRFGDKYYREFKVGDRVKITICDEFENPEKLTNAEKIAEAEIVELVCKKIKDIKQEDVIGDPEAWPKSSLIAGLSEIYSKRIGRNVTEEDFVTIVKFRVIL